MIENKKDRVLTLGWGKKTNNNTESTVRNRSMKSAHLQGPHNKLMNARSTLAVIGLSLAMVQNFCKIRTSVQSRQTRLIKDTRKGCTMIKKLIRILGEPLLEGLWLPDFGKFVHVQLFPFSCQFFQKLCVTSQD